MMLTDCGTSSSGVGVLVPELVAARYVAFSVTVTASWSAATLNTISSGTLGAVPERSTSREIATKFSFETCSVYLPGAAGSANSPRLSLVVDDCAAVIRAPAMGAPVGSSTLPRKAFGSCANEERVAPQSAAQKNRIVLSRCLAIKIVHLPTNPGWHLQLRQVVSPPGCRLSGLHGASPKGCRGGLGITELIPLLHLHRCRLRSARRFPGESLGHRISPVSRSRSSVARIERSRTPRCAHSGSTPGAHVPGAS